MARAFFNAAFFYEQQGQIGEELAQYRQVVDRFGQDDAPEMRERVARALCNAGVVLREQGRVEEALARYRQIVQRNDKDDAPGLREVMERAEGRMDEVEQSNRLPP